MTKGSGDAREQPLHFIITTAGTDRNSICWEMHQKAEDVLRGKRIDPTFYPVIYSAADDAERYSAQDTVAAQGNLFLREGTKLLSNEGNALMTIAATSVDYHDTIGGACSCESNTLRYGHHTKSEHACVENFLEANLLEGRGKRDIVSNINFFMNVPVEPDGSLGIVDGISAPGLTVDLRAEMDVIVVVSNCPQVNNPCNGFNPTPVRMIVTA